MQRRSSGRVRLSIGWESSYDANDVLDDFATEALIRKVEREKGAKSQVISSFFSL
jgi:hypothetical protein